MRILKQQRNDKIKVMLSEFQNPKNANTHIDRQEFSKSIIELILLQLRGAGAGGGAGGGAPAAENVKCDSSVEAARSPATLLSRAATGSTNLPKYAQNKVARVLASGCIFQPVVPAWVSVVRMRVFGCWLRPWRPWQKRKC